MITRKEYEQLKAFARIDGAMVGGLWILSFACFIGQFYSPVLGFASLAIGVGSLVFASLRLRRFRDYVLEGVISFRRAYVYSLLVYFYAALLMAAAQFVYFQFMDHGFMLRMYTETMSTPEFKTMLQLYGIKGSEMNMLIENLQALRPIDIALQFLTSDIILGAVISLPSAAMIMRRGIRNNKNI